MDILTQLSDEHAQLRVHLERIQSAAQVADGAQLRAKLLAAQDALGSDLDEHMRQEETNVFVAASETLGAELVRLFEAEHLEVRALRDEIFASLARGEAPHDTSLRLCDLILDHQQREDLMLFPSARAALSAG